MLLETEVPLATVFKATVVPLPLTPSHHPQSCNPEVYSGSTGVLLHPSLPSSATFTLELPVSPTAPLGPCGFCNSVPQPFPVDETLLLQLSFLPSLMTSTKALAPGTKSPLVSLTE